MKRAFPLLLILFSIALKSNSQVVDVAPSGRQAYLPVEGGSIPMKIDFTTPLDSLLQRLNKDWRLIETGKGYWIGYTHDMFSIAARGDSAIQPLVSFFYSTNSLNGKEGVIYCLHLIGINSTIVGRFMEEFVNPQARAALLGLASDPKYLRLIVTLLARDPWKSDLPVLKKLLSDHFDLDLVNALFRYTAPEFPFRQDIATTLDSINVYLEDSTGRYKIGYLKTVYRETQQSESEKGNNMKNVVTQLNLPTGRVFRKFIANPSQMKKIQSYFPCKESELQKSGCEKINDLLFDLMWLSETKVGPFSYCRSDDKFHHYVENDNIIIITPQITRLRWLRYFQSEKSN
jgi:hypothetical protein